MNDAFDKAQRALERTTAAFQNTEALYFERKVTTEALRLAWAEMDEARRALDRAAKERLRAQGIL